MSGTTANHAVMDIRNGVDVINVLEATEKSIQRGGTVVALKS